MRVAAAEGGGVELPAAAVVAAEEARGVVGAELTGDELA